MAPDVVMKLHSTEEDIRQLQDAMNKMQIRIPKQIETTLKARIKQLTEKLESGRLKIVEEKKIEAELAAVKRDYRVYETMEAKATALDAARPVYEQQCRAAGLERFTSEIAKLERQLAAMQQSRRDQYKDFKPLRDELHKLNAEYQQYIGKKDTLYQEMNERNQEYYKWQQEYRQQRQKQVIERETAHEIEEFEKLFTQERESANMPAYTLEITMCDTLTNFLVSLMGSRSATSPAETSDKCKSPKSEKSVPESENAPKGVMLARKENRSLDYFVGKKKASKSSAAANKGSTNQLKFPLSILQEFCEIKVRLWSI